jgi:hypothetical protein
VRAARMAQPVQVGSAHVAAASRGFVSPLRWTADS